MKFKKHLIVGLVFALLASGLWTASVYASTGCFNDTNGNWAETYICWMKDNGITTGTGGGNYSPNSNVTRAEMAVFFQRLFNLSQSGNMTIQAPAKEWYPAPGNVLSYSAASYIAQYDLTLNSNGNFYLYLVPTLPLAMYNRPLKITGFQLCYSADTNIYISTITLYNTGLTYTQSILTDNTIRTDFSTCPTFTLASPYTMKPNETLGLGVIVTRANAGSSIHLGSANFFIDTTP